MRQLNSTGWMHNRLRMITASFLVKDLLIDWREGERYFMSQLIDGDLAANNGGWQWAASTVLMQRRIFVFSTRQLRARNLTAKANLSASGYRSCAMYRGKRCMSRGSGQRNRCDVGLSATDSRSQEARLRTLAAYEEAREPDKTQRAFYQAWCWLIKTPAPARGF